MLALFEALTVLFRSIQFPEICPWQMNGCLLFERLPLWEWRSLVRVINNSLLLSAIFLLYCYQIIKTKYRPRVSVIIFHNLHFQDILKMKSPRPSQRRIPPNSTASYPRRPGSSVALWFTTTSGRPKLATRLTANLVVTEIPSHHRSALHQFTYSISVLRWRHVMTPQKLSLAVQVFGYNN